MTDDVIATMRSRLKQLRNLADHINDLRAQQVLTAMATELETDIRQLISQKTDTLQQN